MPSKTSPGSPGPSLEVVSEGSAPGARTPLPQTSVDFISPTSSAQALSAAQVNAQFLAQQAEDLKSEVQRQRELHGG